ncbi:Dimodular nonribosomal peptide synthase [Roseovarius litorisediminis]|uniref:Dimodular nonribosomal peptide synthase n=1 Tax=Roseovarius litorisediminis TaxID=1312363 RepID=A0A1Y5TV99_9RHOB|nr:amino acid adenylation domain-containing protein [Roseovarius litorisediminis]SLN71027.1 Dimodular nonribosomal peptide synthase [Roseovarius litorisediminis]
MTRVPETGPGQTGFDGNLAKWFDNQAQSNPDAIAIIDDRARTYDQLRRRMMAYTRGLSTYDLQPESTVALLVSRDFDMVALMLAILWCGHAYVPIDPDDPVDRGIGILNAASCALVVTDATHHARLKTADAAGWLPPLVLNGAMIKMGEDRDTFVCAPGGARLAYILFTSGSTGVPKGVEVEHRQVLHILKAAGELFDFRPSDRYLAVATIAFDISLVELFLPLVNGGSLLLRSRTLLLEPKRLFSELKQHDVNIVQLGPSSWSVMLESGVEIPPLKVAITTGEAVAPDLAERLGRVADIVWNLYGPTETTVWVTGQRLDSKASPTTPVVSAISAPIGIPLPRCTAIVVDEADRPVQYGSIGELMIGGAGLARGYRDNPELTVTKYVTLESGGQRLYRTGDLVSRDANGIIHYHGRIDDQLNIRGVRIEPREVETALLALPEVTQAAATWFVTPAGPRGLCCAIVWAPGQSLTFDEVQNCLRSKIPAAMVPSRFVALKNLPLTANGKVDRKSVRDASIANHRDEVPVINDALDVTDTEGRLLSIWANVLGTKTVTLDTHFFAEGGDSLSAIVMMMYVEKSLGAKMGPDAIAKAPRLRDFARTVEILRWQPVDLNNQKTIFPLVEEGDGPPLFFSNIDQKLGRSAPWKGGCPLYAIVQWAHGRGFVKAKSIQQLAAAQIREIRAIQNSGPYRIGGYSLGGLIALEIASQLHALDEEVELLFLLDPMSPVQYRSAQSGETVESHSYQSPPFAERLVRQLRNLVRDPVASLPKMGSKTMGELRKLRVWQRLAYHRLDLYGRYPSRLTSFLVPKNRWPAFWMMAQQLARSYVAQQYKGACLAVFHDQGGRYEIWQSILSETAELAVVEASHLGLFEEPAVNIWMDLVSHVVNASGDIPLKTDTSEAVPSTQVPDS